MDERFRSIEEEVKRLKKKLYEKKISREEFIKELKKLRLKDDEGRFWMVGAQSGKWYYFDGKEWIQAKPPSFQEKKAICVHCGFENSLFEEVCVKCGMILGETTSICPRCGQKIEEASKGCPSCGKELNLGSAEGTEFKEERVKFSLRSINILSFFLFWGVLGAFTGIILGSFVGATDYLREFLRIFPSALRASQGTLMGGLLYAGSGAVLGFFAFGGFGLLCGGVVNIILSFIGGIKADLERFR